MTNENKAFKYDVEKAYGLILSEGYEGPRLAGIMSKQIATLHPDVWPAVTAWLDGKFIEHEFQGITFKQIMHKEKTSYIGAIFSMSVLIENPEFVDIWKNRSFMRV